MELGLSAESQTQKFPALSPTLLLGKEEGAKAAAVFMLPTLRTRQSAREGAWAFPQTVSSLPGEGAVL